MKDFVKLLYVAGYFTAGLILLADLIVMAIGVEDVELVNFVALNFVAILSGIIATGALIGATHLEE